MPIKSSKVEADIIAQTLAELDVNIISQTLAELISRNKYGAYHLVFGLVGLGSLGEKTLISISGQGVIYGGMICCFGLSGSETDSFKLEIDDVLTHKDPFEYYMDWGIVLPGSTPLFLNRYDLENNYFAVSISPDITFETSMKMIYDCNAVGDRVYFEFHYATI